LQKLLDRIAAAGSPLWPQALEHTLERCVFYPVLVAEWAEASGDEGALAHARQLLDAVAG
jgi:hypothetical protein